ncbi:MAG: DUF998 domain-containing protein [Methanomicrobiales archaeon]|nr:DUF998 domain-containing protein [Methanomicrobiales archaeon]
MDPARDAPVAFTLLSAACGMAAPITFFGTVLALGFLRPEYSHVTQLMSELGIPGSPYAPVMALVGFALTGFLLTGFAPGVYHALGRQPGGIWGSLLIGVVGLCFVAEAFFPCDAGCIPVATPGRLHGLFATLAVVVTIAALFLLAYAMKRHGGWNGYWQYTVVTGAVVLLLVAFFPSLAAVRGLAQRVMIGVPFLWTEVVAIRLFRDAGMPVPGDSG